MLINVKHFHVSHTSNNKRSQHFTSRCQELQISGNEAGGDYLPLPPLALLGVLALVPLPMPLLPYPHVSFALILSNISKHFTSGLLELQISGNEAGGNYLPPLALLEPLPLPARRPTCLEQQLLPLAVHFPLRSASARTLVHNNRTFLFSFLNMTQTANAVGMECIAGQLQMDQRAYSQARSTMPCFWVRGSSVSLE